jgi:hypothetical protein
MVLPLISRLSARGRGLVRVARGRPSRPAEVEDRISFQTALGLIAWTENGMATRQQRIDAFVHDGEPPVDQPLQVLCEDHIGTYVVPFPCRWSGDWKNAETGERIEAMVIGWRGLVATE